MLKSNLNDVPKRIESVHAQLKELSRENESLQSKLSMIEAGQLTDQVKTVGGKELLAVRVTVGSMDGLRTLADELKNKLPSAVLVLGAASKTK
ncbi:alanyl-tRNA synthetase [Paenibacillus sp. P1XP2]|nr:alanyl-tRNA synthetase [Paenibacillus sp. P1XP2]